MTNILKVFNRGSSQVAPRKLSGHDGVVSFVAFLSNGARILSAAEDGTVRLWTVSDGHNRVLQELTVSAIATSPNEQWIAVGGVDGKVRVWDSEMRAKIKSLAVGGQSAAVKSLSFSPDSSTLASGAKDGTLLVWNTSTYQKVAGPYEGHDDCVWWLSYSPDGRRIASCDRESIKIWDPSSGFKVAIEEKAWSLTWSHDGQGILAGSTRGFIKYFDSLSGLQLATFEGHSNTVFSIAISHNNRFIASASWDKTVRIWDISTRTQIGPALQHPTNVHSISISPDDSHVVSGAQDSHLRVWNIRSIVPSLFDDTPAGVGHTVPPRQRRATSNSTVNHRPPIVPSRSRSAHGSVGSEYAMTSDTDHNSAGSVCSQSEHATEHRQSNPALPPIHPTTSSPQSHRRSLPTEMVQRRNESRNSMTREVVRSQTARIGPIRQESEISATGEIWSSLTAWNLHDIHLNFPRDLTGSIIKEGNHPVSSGAHGDIYRGMLRIGQKPLQVAIKVIKIYMNEINDDTKLRNLHKEIKLWLRLDHKNLLPLLGTTKDFGDFPAMVCPWVENGTLTKYLERRCDLTIQSKLVLLHDVAEGLEYLHSQEIVHGDLSGSNILVHGDGRACIADFGLSRLMVALEGSSFAETYKAKGTLRWAAPELFDEATTDDPIAPTAKGDIYSFGMIMLQVLTGKLPYHYYQRDVQVMAAISRGELPKRPSREVVSDVQWGFLLRCWSPMRSEEHRPSGEEIGEFLKEQLTEDVAVAS